MNDTVLQPLLNRIKTAIPEIKIHSAALLSTGEINDVVLVNDTLVFRFPRQAADAARLKHEHRLMTYLWGQVPLHIPNPVYHHPEGEDIPFMEYVHLAGEPLDRHLEPAKNHCQPIAAQLADFMQDLHKVALDELELPVQNASRKKNLPQLHEAIQMMVFPHLSDAARHRISQQFAEFCDTPRLEETRLVIRHGELAPNNILVDPRQFSITGIIDFGSAGLDDPAFDLGHIACWGTQAFGDGFVETFLRRYGADQELRERVDFYSTLVACILVLSELEGDSKAELQAALDCLNQA